MQQWHLLTGLRCTQQEGIHARHYNPSCGIRAVAGEAMEPREPTTLPLIDSVSSSHMLSTPPYSHRKVQLSLFFFFQAEITVESHKKLFKMQKTTNCGCPDPTDRSTAQSLHPRLKNILEKEGILRAKGPWCLLWDSVLCVAGKLHHEHSTTAA